jgi:tripartite-type tricarboxylate transporter receptor subunit TctC
MPADIAAKINKDVNAALQSADLKERLMKLGAEPMNMTIPQFTDFVRREIEDSQQIIKAAGIKPQ